MRGTYNVPARTYEHAISLHGRLYKMHILPAQERMACLAMAL